ncbi:HAD family hydrolase [Arhodomonas sp. SL1]|uniref:HAD family hydrolase n=1 Tax=Arhodomonas sp. SL1 TaxID=3425691 RepID=UPI003F883643
MAEPAWSRVRGVLFDKDGTLFDYHRTWGPVNRAAALEAAGGDAALAERLLVIGGVDPASGRAAGGSLLAAGHTGEIAEAWAAEMGLDDGRREALVWRLDAVFLGHGPGHAVPVTELAPLFRRLRGAGLRLGVATSDGERAARAMLAGFVDPDALDFVAGYDSGHGGKPAPGMVHGFCAATGVSEDSVLVAGDNLHDLRMARAAGCGVVVGVLTGTGGREELAAEADIILDDVAALPARLGIR